jgi:hypothetical protein
MTCGIDFGGYFLSFLFILRVFRGFKDWGSFLYFLLIFPKKIRLLPSLSDQGSPGPLGLRYYYCY